MEIVVFLEKKAVIYAAYPKNLFLYPSIWTKKDKESMSEQGDLMVKRGQIGVMDVYSCSFSFGFIFSQVKTMASWLCLPLIKRHTSSFNYY